LYEFVYTRDGQEKTLRKLFKYEFYFEY